MLRSPWRYLLAPILATSAMTGSVSAEDASPASCAPWLDAAAESLGEGRIAEAVKDFESVVQDPSALPFVRGLALLGLAEAASVEGGTASIAAWERLATETAVPQFFRDEARRRIAEAQRRRQSLPGRDPAAYRAPLPELPVPAVVFHVSLIGDDANNGSEGSPFRTLSRARDAVRALKADRDGALPSGGIHILICGGTYHVEQTFHLTAEDSGTAGAPVVYRSKPGEIPIFRGGTRLTGWKPISDPARRNQLDPAVRDRVLELNLKDHGVTNWGDATDLRRRPELFLDGVPQTLARWPNEGFVKTGEILGTDTFTLWNTIQGCRDGKFRYLEDRPNHWVDEPDVRLYGYWFWDWFEEYQTVASIDAQTRSFKLSPPFSNYGYRQGQRYLAVNLFCEIDAPGEWYLDRRDGKAYWLPTEGVDLATAETVLSVWDAPFIMLDDVEHVLLIGWTFQEGRHDGIHLNGGANCLIAGCTVRQLGGDAIVIKGGLRHGIFGCTMHTLGCGGARVAGGDRAALEPGQHFVENCTVHDISRIKRTYTPAVHLDGCGNRIAHNLFERIPSSAMRIEGNDHLVELNTIRHVVQESDDQGGIDMFGNPLYRGVVIRWNRWSDITGGTHCGAAGIRLDDMISGIVVHGNIFERCGAVLFGGVQIHGGKENLVDGNLFVDCHAGISFSHWGAQRWREAIGRFLAQAKQPPYTTHYPSLAQLEENADVNYISRNLFAGCGHVFLRDDGISKSVLNGVMDRATDPQLVSSAASIREVPQLNRLLIAPIPIAEIGPYEHPWRR
ncbi:MAG: right-handed parallel beta-helix repeat-containing protein [Pirellulales bacterium]|nr:right-handed parallel beta-helix repeat-containing protein [Pirellulales bacterium]